MADYQVLDATGATITISATDIGGGVLSANIGLRDYPKGQALMAASLPVVVASDQGAIPASQSGAWVLTASAATVAGGRGSPSNSLRVSLDNTVTLVDNNGFTDNSSLVIGAGFIYDDVAGVALTENDIAAARINANRGLVIVGEDETTRGRRWTIKPASTPAVDTDTALVVDFLPGHTWVGANNLAKAEDAVHGSGDVGIMALAVRADTPASSGANGDYVTLTEDSTGYLRAVAKNEQLAATTGSITANSGQTVSVSTVGYAGVLVAVNGTYNTVNDAFELSFDGGTTWTPVQAVRTDSSTAETTTGNLTNQTRAWDVYLGGATNFRVRNTAWTSGTQTVTLIPIAISQDPVMTGTITLGTGAAVIGAVTQSGTWNVGTVTTVTTVSTLTNITNWGNIVDNAAFTDGTTRLLPAGFIFDDVAGTALTENDAAAARIDSKRAIVIVGEDGTTRAQKWAIDASGNLSVSNKATATGGGTIGKVLSAASTNATNLKNAAGKVHSFALLNTNAAVRYLHLYNKASAPTVGTDVPVATFAIPGAAAGAGVVVPTEVGANFGTGISYSLTTGPADTDNVAVAANEITGWILYT